MRQIKFRATTVNTGEIVESMTITESIGQYTGFEDKNGKEIFEGDILTDKVETDEGEIISKQKVFWNPPTGSWHLDNSFNQDETSSTELWIVLEKFEYEILN